MHYYLLYIDPGTGSILFQIVVAGILGLLFFFRTIFEKIKTISLAGQSRFYTILQTKVIHPYLIGGFFVFHNIKEVLLLYTAFSVISYLLVIMAASAILYFLIFLSTKNRIKSAILLSAFLLMILFYESIYFFLSTIPTLKNNLPGMGYIILFIFLVLAALVFTARRNLSRFNAYLNILFIILLIFEVGVATYTYIENLPNRNLIEGKKINTPQNMDYEAPVIYHILLDAYTGSSSLKKYWNYQNDELENFLLNNGFYIAANAHSNSTATQQSMATTFNMSYLPNLDSIFNNELLSTTAYRNYINHSKIAHELSSRNYSFINLSIFDIGDNLKFHKAGILPDATDLFQLLVQNTRFASYIKSPPYTSLNTNRAIFDSLQNLPATLDGNNVFIYAHINMPHDSYCDRNGNSYSDITNTSNRDENKKYIETLIYTNRLLIAALKKILSRSKTPPVIIIHGDHGSRMFDESEKHTVFSAYYFPDKDYSMLYDSISLVNTYRVICKKYFKENISMLPDKKY